MAYSFDGSNDQLYSSTALIVGSPPITMAIWTDYPSVSDAEECLFIHHQSTTRKYELWMKKQVTGGATYLYGARIKTSLTVTSLSYSISPPPYRTWVCLVSASATDHKLYVEGALQASSTASRDPAMTYATTRIGRNEQSIGSQCWLAANDVSWACIWDEALSADEIADMNSADSFGVMPSKLRPHALRACYPLLLDKASQPNICSGVDAEHLTVDGATFVASGPSLCNPNAEVLVG